MLHRICMKGVDKIKVINMYENSKQVLELIRLRLESLDEVEQDQMKEKERLKKLYENYQKKIEKMEGILKELTGIEYSLYYDIAVKGSTINKAVDKVALDYDVSSSIVWKKHYPKIKSKLE